MYTYIYIYTYLRVYVQRINPIMRPCANDLVLLRCPESLENTHALCWAHHTQQQHAWTKGATLNGCQNGLMHKNNKSRHESPSHVREIQRQTKRAPLYTLLVELCCSQEMPRVPQNADQHSIGQTSLHQTETHTCASEMRQRIDGSTQRAFCRHA